MLKHGTAQLAERFQLAYVEIVKAHKCTHSNLIRIIEIVYEINNVKGFTWNVVVLVLIFLVWSWKLRILTPLSISSKQILRVVRWVLVP